MIEKVNSSFLDLRRHMASQEENERIEACEDGMQKTGMNEDFYVLVLLLILGIACRDRSYISIGK